MKLNLGCGPVQPPGWTNVDNSHRAWLASRFPGLDRLLVRTRLLPSTEHNRNTTFANLHGRFPWNDHVAEAIYAGEVLEHFVPKAGEQFLRECFRVLKKGGILRVRVPDNARFWHNYLQEYESTKRLDRREWNTGHERWVTMFFRHICTGNRVIRLGSMGHFHKWAYDEVSLVVLFERVGLVHVERMPFRTSRIADVDCVEIRDDLIVEGAKPTS